MPVIAIVGAGPGLGLSIARRFGREGFTVALISLADGGAVGRRGPVRPGRRAGVLPGSVRGTAGPGHDGCPPVTAENVQSQVEFYVYGAIAAVQAVRDGMLERGRGTLLFTTGASSAITMPAGGQRRHRRRRAAQLRAGPQRRAGRPRGIRRARPARGVHRLGRPGNPARHHCRALLRPVPIPRSAGAALLGPVSPSPAPAGPGLSLLAPDQLIEFFWGRTDRRSRPPSAHLAQGSGPIDSEQKIRYFYN
jgi:hypothetical protein